MLVERTAPVSARVVPMPGRTREVTVLHPALAGRYTALVAAVAERAESSMTPSVAANRVVSSSVDPPSLVLRPWRLERATFGRRLARLSRAAPCLVFADVRACYRSIAPDVVAASLVGLGCDPAPSAAVAAFVERLGAHGVVGLPIGPEPSAVLANAVLAVVDRALVALGARHLRWVDDLAVGVDGPGEAGTVLGVVRDALGRVGLELNEAKTRVILDPATGPPVRSVSVARRSPEVG